MFYNKLRNIYDDKPALQEFPFEEYYPLLKRYTLEESSLGGHYLSPYRFSFNFGINPENALRFFLFLSDEKYGLLKQVFKYECNKCYESSLFVQEEILNECPWCNSPINTNHIFDEIKVLFKMQNGLFEEMVHSLKVQSPSTTSNQGLEGDTETTLRKAIDINTSGGTTASDDLAQVRLQVERKLAFNLELL